MARKRLRSEVLRAFLFTAATTAISVVGACASPPPPAPNASSGTAAPSPNPYLVALDFRQHSLFIGLLPQFYTTQDYVAPHVAADGFNEDAIHTLFNRSGGQGYLDQLTSCMQTDASSVDPAGDRGRQSILSKCAGQPDVVAFLDNVSRYRDPGTAFNPAAARKFIQALLDSALDLEVKYARQADPDVDSKPPQITVVLDHDDVAADCDDHEIHISPQVVKKILADAIADGIDFDLADNRDGFAHPAGVLPLDPGGYVYAYLNYPTLDLPVISSYDVRQQLARIPDARSDKRLDDLFADVDDVQPPQQQNARSDFPGPLNQKKSESDLHLDVNNPPPRPWDVPIKEWMEDHDSMILAIMNPDEDVLEPLIANYRNKLDPSFVNSHDILARAKENDSLVKYAENSAGVLMPSIPAAIETYKTLIFILAHESYHVLTGRCMAKGDDPEGKKLLKIENDADALAIAVYLDLFKSLDIPPDDAALAGEEGSAAKDPQFQDMFPADGYRKADRKGGADQGLPQARGDEDQEDSFLGRDAFTSLMALYRNTRYYEGTTGHPPMEQRFTNAKSLYEEGKAKFYADLSHQMDAALKTYRSSAAGRLTRPAATRDGPSTAH